MSLTDIAYRRYPVHIRLRSWPLHLFRSLMFQVQIEARLMSFSGSVHTISRFEIPSATEWHVAQRALECLMTIMETCVLNRCCRIEASFR